MKTPTHYSLACGQGQTPAVVALFFYLFAACALVLLLLAGMFVPEWSFAAREVMGIAHREWMLFAAFAAAAVGYSENRYIPNHFADQVIAATDVLGPGEKEVIIFTAPATPGEYPFVCSFPGHTQAGMRGIMTVIP